MAQIRFTSALKRFYPKLEQIQLPVKTIAELVSTLDQHYPMLSDYLVNENGELRQHILIYIGDDIIQDRTNLSDKISETDEIWIVQALSGG